MYVNNVSSIIARHLNVWEGGPGVCGAYVNSSTMDESALAKPSPYKLKVVSFQLNLIRLFWDFLSHVDQMGYKNSFGIPKLVQVFIVTIPMGGLT